MSRIEFNGLPTLIGSLPYTDPEEACRKVLRFTKDLPAWPQLYRRSPRESFYIQFSQGFPGLVTRDDKVMVDRGRDLESQLEKLDSASRRNEYYKYPVSADYAAGFHQFITCTDIIVTAVKGQITGPVSWSTSVADNDGNVIANDRMLARAAAQLLKLKAAWMESELHRVSKQTLIFVDEPVLSSLGSDKFPLSTDRAVSLIREVFSGIKGVKGLHCHGKCDWRAVLSTHPDVLSLDAYACADSLTGYPKEVGAYLSGGGAIAWGIVPVAGAELGSESSGSLMDRLEESMAPFTRRGYDLPFRQLVSQSLITPVCGLGGLSPDGADRALELLGDVSEKIRGRWG